MDRLNQMLTFAKVAETGSFSDAGRQLGVGKAAVSLAVSRLEETLGVRLLHRSTRQLSLTEAGDRYYQLCARIGEELDLADAQVRTLGNTVSGTIRVTCPVGFGTRVLMPLVEEFLVVHPDVHLDLLLDDRSVNLVEEGVDVALRVASLADSDLIARPLVQTPLVLCAAPRFFEQHGMPHSPEDLNRLPWVIFSHLPESLEHVHDGVRYVIKPSGRVRVNNEQARLQLVLSGFGLTLAPLYETWEAINDGRLIKLDFGIPLPTIPIVALYISRKFLPHKIGVFLDFLQQRLSALPWTQTTKSY